jgi:hypothetical protein
VVILGWGRLEARNSGGLGKLCTAAMALGTAMESRAIESAKERARRRQRRVGSRGTCARLDWRRTGAGMLGAAVPAAMVATPVCSNSSSIEHKGSKGEEGRGIRLSKTRVQPRWQRLASSCLPYPREAAAWPAWKRRERRRNSSVGGKQCSAELL